MLQQRAILQQRSPARASETHALVRRMLRRSAVGLSTLYCCSRRMWMRVGGWLGGGVADLYVSTFAHWVADSQEGAHMWGSSASSVVGA